MLYWFKISLGATKIENLVNNIGSLKVKLTDEDLKEISDALSAEGFAGERLTGPFTSNIWQDANTLTKYGKTSLLAYIANIYSVQVVLYLSIIRLYRGRVKEISLI